MSFVATSSRDTTTSQHKTLRAMLSAMENTTPDDAKDVAPDTTEAFFNDVAAMVESSNLMEMEGSPLPTNTPESSIYSADGSDYDMDEDAMVDAAVNDNGLFTNALLSEEHIVLDAALLHEMDELLARDDTTQWNQLHLESPSLSFPAPGAPWTMGHPTPSTERTTTESFVPHGEGWEIQDVDSSRSGDNHDVDMEDTRPDIEVDHDTQEMELLARQLKFLEAQREFLDYKASLAASSEDPSSAALISNRRDAIQEKRRLVEAQLHKEMLMKVAKQQLENLKYMELMLLQSPVTHYRHTLMTPMASYIHLTKDPKERRATLLGLRDENIDSTRRFIDFQCRNIDLERQFFYLDTFEKFGKFYTVDFSISKLDDVSVNDVVNVIYNHFVSTKDMISQILGSVENREYFDGLEWTFLNARFVDRINLPKKHRDDRGFVVQESNTVYYVKRFGDTVVMTCDWIDKDDLHPYRTSGRIRKDTNVGVIVEPFIDSQGNESVLLKRFSFVRHHFKNIEPTLDLIQAISTKVILWGQALMTRAAEVMELTSES